MAEKKPIVLRDNERAHDPIANGDTVGVQYIPVSQQPGNMIERRDDGLYYGTQAPPDISTLFIDSTGGDDSNPGTRAAPLRTIAEASRRTPAQQSNTWALRCGRTYLLDLDVYVVAGAIRIIRCYDDPWIDGANVPTPSPEYPAYLGEFVEQVNRPVIKAHIRYNDVGQFCNVCNLNATGGAQIQPHGIIFDFKPDNDVEMVGKQGYKRYNAAMFYGSSGGSVSLYGCKFITPPIPDGFPDAIYWWHLASASSFGDVLGIQLNSCRWETGGGETLITVGGADNTIFGTHWPTDEDNPIPPPGTKIVDNVIGRLEAESRAVLGVLKGPAGDIRNVNSNILLP